MTDCGHLIFATGSEVLNSAVSMFYLCSPTCRPDDLRFAERRCKSSPLVKRDTQPRTPVAAG